MLAKAWLVMAAAICGIQMLCLITVESLSEADKIQTLPGQPQVSFQQFGGYISVDEKQDKALFYYFAEAETDPASKPVVLWLNGGPGCSSIGAGAFCEHGPFKPSGQILVKNDYSWNKEANMLYLESPAGVGFSYSADASFYAGVDDNITARDNLVFLENWFNKFPEYKNRDFFIAGESYGGHYVPQLAQLIIQSKVQFNLKGIAIGNPLLEFNTDFNSRAEYYWSHGLVSDDTYELFNNVCNYSQIRRQAQNNGLTPGCSQVNSQATSEISKFINGYDVTLDVCLSSINSQAQVLSQLELMTTLQVELEMFLLYYSGDIAPKLVLIFAFSLARDNLVFLENWFNKFPEYKNRDFFIAGESYGGHFVPQLAQLIIQSKVDQLNLKGIAIGNPLLEFNTDFNSRAEYYWSHGLVSDDTYELFNTVCNFSQIRRQADNNALTPVCSRVNSQARREMSKFIDEFDVTLDVCLSSVNSQAQVLSQLQESTKIDVCIRDETTNYLNMEDVQKAFHARLVGVTRWSVCSDVLQYDMENLEIPMTPVLASLIKSGIRVLVYSGDQDSVIPLTGTRTLVNGLAKELALNTTVPYRVWFEGSQVGGWTQVYGDVLSFATIRGASHEPPFSQPERSLVLFDTFLGGKPLPQGVLAAETIHK